MVCWSRVQLRAPHLLSARYGLDGVWLACPVVFVTMLVLQSAFYRLVWRHKKIERLVQTRPAGVGRAGAECAT